MSGFFVQNVWMIPCFPLLGAVVAAVGARRLRSRAHVPVVAGIVLAFLVSLWRALLGKPRDDHGGGDGGCRSATSRSPSSSGSTG